MSLRIEKFTESRSTNAFYHKVADIPAGVTVKTSGYANGGVITEGAPLYAAEDGLYNAATSAKVVEVAGASATDYVVEKGHLYAVGDKIQKTASTSVNITAINTSDPNKDTITVDATLGAKAIGDVVGQFYTGTPVAVVGEGVTFRKGDNVLVSAWVIAVINKNMIPEPASKPAGVLYV